MQIANTCTLTPYHTYIDLCTLTSTSQAFRGQPVAVDLLLLEMGIPLPSTLGEFRSNSWRENRFAVIPSLNYLKLQFKKKKKKISGEVRNFVGISPKDA
jgi:hypothetical protein